MAGVETGTALPWRAVEEEWRGREFGLLRHGVERLGTVDLAAVDDLLFAVGSPAGDASRVLTAAFADAADGEDGPLLLAMYVYGRCLEKWETSEDYDRIEAVLAGLGAAVAALPPPATPAARLAVLASRQAQTIRQGMSVEDGLSCSCPVAVGARATAIVDTLDALWSDATGQDGAGAAAVLRSDAETSRRYFGAVAAAAAAVEAFADQTSPGRIPDLTSLLAPFEADLAGDVYASELRAHHAALVALAEGVDEPRLWVDDAELVYVYPFALGNGVTVSADASKLPLEPFARAGLPVEVRPLVVNDLWDPIGPVEESHSGLLLTLPPLRVDSTAREVYPDEIPPIELRAELRLSTLGNHYLRLTTRLTGDGPHDVNQALRRGSTAMGHETITSGDRKWTTIAGYAEDVIAAVGEAFETEPVVSLRTPFHVVLSALSISVRSARGAVRPATSGDLAGAFGSTLLFHPVRHLATALEEWVRYPQPVVRNLLGEEAYEGDLVARTDNTTIVFMPASPEWLVEEYLEMIEFAASLPPLLQLWEEEAVASAQAFDDASDLAEGELTILEAEQRIRRDLAFLHSPALCRTGAQRRFLDKLWAAAGYPVLEAEIDRRLTLFAERHERIAAFRRRAEEQQRRALEIVLAFLAAFSFAGVLQWIDGTFGDNPPHGPIALWLEVALLFGVVAAVVVAAGVVRRRAHDAEMR